MKMDSGKKFGKIDLKSKIIILSRLEEGESPTDIAREYGVTRSAISHLKRKKTNILQYASFLENTDGNFSKKTMSRAKDNELENAVYTWFRQKRLLGESMTGPIICQQALILNEKLGGSSTFKASNGWLMRFKRRHGIRQISTDGEKLSPDTNAVEVFVDEFRKRLQEGGYKAENIYNADETGLQWKSLPQGTLVCRQETAAPRRKVNNDRVTAMVCANATGNHRLPVLVIGKHKKPRCLRNTMCLPVTYKAQKSGWMDRDVFTDWYTNHFVPAVKERQAATGESGKVILLLDSAPSHPSAESLNAVDDNYEVIYFPQHVAAVIQPMNQGVIEKLKRRYRRNLLNDLVIGETAESVVEYFNKLTLKDCVRMLAYAWALLTNANFKNAWKKVMPELKNNETSANVDDVSVSDLVALLHTIPGCGNCDEEGTKTWMEEDKADPGWEITNDYAIMATNRQENAENQNLEDLEDPQGQVRANENEPSAWEAFAAANTLRTWAQQHPKCRVGHLMALDDFQSLAVNSFH